MCIRHQSIPISAMIHVATLVILGLVSLNTLPGVSVQETLLGCCSVWAWRKPGINSWLRAEPTTSEDPKTPKTPSENPRHPPHQKDPLYIYIYIRGCQNGVSFLSFGVQNGGGVF